MIKPKIYFPKKMNAFGTWKQYRVVKSKNILGQTRKMVLSFLEIRSGTGPPTTTCWAGLCRIFKARLSNVVEQNNDKSKGELVDVPETEGAVNSSLKDTFRDLIVLVHFPECERGYVCPAHSTRKFFEGGV